MRVLVTFAVEAEFAPWRKLRTLEARQSNGFTVHQAKIGRAWVDFVVTGMGMENARRGTEGVLAPEHVVCIASGFAGSLKPELAIGQVLAARAVRQMDKAKTLECSRNLTAAACFNGAMEAKLLLTSNRVVATASEKLRLAPFAEAVDMESFATMEVAKERGVPAMALRVISDCSGEDVPAEIETTLDDRGRVKVGGVIRYVAAHPLHVPALIRLGRKSHTAAEALAHFLEAFLKELSFRNHGWPPPHLQEVASR